MAGPADLRIPGQSPPNPLLVLAQACDNIVVELKKMNHGEHSYALQATDEEGTQYLVYCLACSSAQERYVHPCAVKGEHLAPPQGFRVDRSEPTG